MSFDPRFEHPPETTGLDVIDPVETRHFSLFTDESVTPTPADTGAFEFPVDTACRITTASLELPYMIPIDVRTPDGDHRASVDSPTVHELPDADHLLEFHSPIKIYLRVSGRGEIETTTEGVTFRFDGQTAVEVGARSYHSAPAETVTVPDDPEAMLEAVSTFSSALKTTSPERAWPTLRGHPPRIERGDELSIPDDLSVPDTGVRVTVPPEYWAVYAVAPLSYYLGATVVPGERARVTADSGVDHPLGDGPESSADAMAALLKRVFFLDCVVRTEGLYPDPLHERDVLESRVDLDLAGLYDATPDERLAAYLSVPDEAIEAIASPWHRVTHVEPVARSVELLPYVVNDLSLVRPEVPSDAGSLTDAQRELDQNVEAFLRNPSRPTEATAEGGFVRSTSSGQSTDSDRSGGRSGKRRRAGEDRPAPDGTPDLDEYVSLPEVEALEQAWVGEGTPLRGTKLLREAFANDTPEPSDGTVDVTVVCNDSEMREESDSVGEIYGSRDDVRVSVTSEFGVGTDELRELLARDTDVFHFIGHIDGAGFQCPDGILDAATVTETNATTALLNGCRSHDQGTELVRAGANAAIVSLADLFNEGAVEVGQTFARLLHHGFDIGSTMKIIREYTSIGNRYVVLGDPGVVVSESDGIIPMICHIRDDGGDNLDIEPHAYPVHGGGLGTVHQPERFGIERYHIAIGSYDNTTVARKILYRWTMSENEPLVVNDKLAWSGAWLNQA